MKQLILTACLLATLSGCSMYSKVREAWYFEPSTQQPAAPVPISDAEAAALKQKRDELRGQSAQARTGFSGTSTPSQRIPIYSELHRLGMPLSDAERKLWLAGRAEN